MKKFWLMLLSIMLIFSLWSCGTVSAPGKEPLDTEAGLTTISEVLADEPMSPLQLSSYLSTLGYSDEEIDILIKTAEINWQAQIQRYVEPLLNEIPYSRLALINLLTIDLEYDSNDVLAVIDAMNIQWKELCLYDATILKDTKQLEKDEIIEQLTSKQYLQEEIDYAIKELFEDTN